MKIFVFYRKFLFKNVIEIEIRSWGLIKDDDDLSGDGEFIDIWFVYIFMICVI